MKAAVYRGEQVLLVEDVPDPVPGPGQAVMKVRYAAICGTDVHAFMYDIAKPGTVLGHEFAGTIVDVGEGVSRVKAGDRVVGGGGQAPPGTPPGPGRIHGSTTAPWVSSTTRGNWAMPSTC